jgi:hypothetical protein
MILSEKMGVSPVTISFERVRELLKTEQYNEFLKFMKGQTVTGEGVFDNDFLRFVKKLPVID